ncbi:MAG: rod shape-determining protein RodA [Clostridia bacterium]|nr:rod shape-determining protein RodA [Clostridia bacterium]
MYSVEKSKGISFTKKIDYILFIAVLVLSAMGIVILDSATKAMASGSRMMTIQIVSLGIGLVLSLIVSSIDYKDFKVLGVVLYIVSVALLVLVLIIGTGDKEWGSKSWIRLGSIGFQPSELAKISFIMVSSLFLEKISEGEKNKNILKLIIYAVIPVLLVLKQPDTGTAIVFIFAFCAMIFVAGIPYKYIWITAATFLASLPLAWFFVLKDYQKSRIMVYLNPELDKANRGYQVYQSKMVIGSGQLYGKGLYSGIQTQNGSVPVRESDFIFTVIGEELGFIGAAIIVALVFFILLRCMYVARNSRDKYGAFLVVGVTSMLAFHFIENIGMCIGLLPVTGIPLPFISYGGSSMITNYIAIGMILSVSMRRKRTIFNSSQ